MSFIKASTFECGRQATDCVADSAVVPVAKKVSEHKGFDFFHRHVFCVVSAIDGFGLKASPHALAFGIVMAAAAIGIHALDNAEVMQASPEIITGILASPVCMENSASYAVEAVGRCEALYYQRRLHVVIHGKAQAKVIEAVKHRRDVEIPIGCW